jgi:hypothetical protein
MLEDIAEIESKIEGYLIVATTAGVQFSPKGTNDLREPPFDAHVHIFVLNFPLMSSGPDVFPNAVQSLDNRTTFTRRQDFRLLQSLTMCHTAFNVVFIKAAIKSYRRRERFNQCVSLALEAPPPEF